MAIALWIVAVALIVVGVVGTVLPLLPGPILVLAGIAVAGWIDDFARIPVWVVVVASVLTVAAWAIDYIAAALGVKRTGASRLAIVGAAIGTVAGILSGLWGLLFMPLAGAAIGEYIVRRDLRRAGQVGVAASIGFLLGTVAKLAMVLTMVGFFMFALLL